MAVHHISADGFSVGPMARDMMMAFIARSAGQAPAWTPLPIQFADFAVWQRDLLGEESDPESLAARQIDYWRETLAGMPDRLVLPTDHDRPEVLTPRGDKVWFEVGATTHQRLQQVARQHGVTMYTVVHAAFTTMLAGMSGTDDITIGTPTAGRGEQELDNLVGMFVNWLVLRSRIERDAPFSRLLVQSRETVLGAHAHADIQFERLVEIVDPVRSTSWNPLTQVALSYQNLAATSLSLPGLEVETLAMEGRIAKNELHLTFTPQAGEEALALQGSFTFATDLYEKSTVAAIADRFVGVLDAVAADPEIVVGTLAEHGATVSADV
jgi:hypothetical protein